MLKVAFKYLIGYNNNEKKVYMKTTKKGKKTNPKVKEQKKLKKVNINNISISEDENNIKKLCFIIIGIIFIIGIVYGVTELIKKDPEKNKDSIAGEINYNKVSVGTILNRPYDTYYVFVYNADDANAVLYSTIMTKYMNKDKSDKIYFCDLANQLNNSYYDVGNDNKSNPKATKTDEFDFGDVTLIKISKGKIVKYIEDLEKIKEILR